MSDAGRAVPVRPAQSVDALAARIRARSLAESRTIVGGDPVFDGSEMWMSGGTRGQARAYYAAEFGIPFTAVRVVQYWMRVDEGAIADLAQDLADENADPDTIAYTYDEEGWLTTGCSSKAPGAFCSWYCTRY